jgi:hypothetical protein
LFPDCAEGDPRTLTNEVCDGFDNDCDDDVDEDAVCGCSTFGFGGRRGILCAEQLTFDDAVAFCAARPGYALLTVRSAAEQSAVVDAIAGFPDVWLGFSDRQAEGTFRDLSDGPLSFTAFSANQPNNLNNQDCVVDTARGWNDVDCDQQLFGVACELSTNVLAGSCVDVDGDGFGRGGCPRGPDCNDDDGLSAVLAAEFFDVDLDGALGTAVLDCVGPLPAPPPPQVAPSLRPDCDDDDPGRSIGCLCTEVLTGGQRFELCVETHDYDVWIEGCQEHLSTLARLTNNTQANKLQDTVDAAAIGSAWINGTDRAVEGIFVLNEGGPLPFTDFAPGEPNNQDGNEDCLEMLSLGFNDDACTERAPAFCGPLP